MRPWSRITAAAVAVALVVWACALVAQSSTLRVTLDPADGATGRSAGTTAVTCLSVLSQGWQNADQTVIGGTGYGNLRDRGFVLDGPEPPTGQQAVIATACADIRTIRLGVAGILGLPITVLVLLAALGGRIPPRRRNAPTRVD